MAKLRDPDPLFPHLSSEQRVPIGPVRHSILFSTKPLLRQATRGIRWLIRLFASCAVALVLCLLFSTDGRGMMSVEEERKVGNEFLRMVEAQVSLVHDPEVVGYVAEMGRKVLAQVGTSFFDYRFFVIRDDGLNAFAVPGGLVFVHSGLLEAVDTGNDLLCVLAHEIGHVEGRHVARRMARMQRVNLATAAVAIAGLFLGKGEAGSAVLATSGALSASIALKYSREDEEAADRRAFQWICQAGYDPRGLVRVFKKMQRYRWLGTDAIPSYLSTHPGASERITYLDDLWQREPCQAREQGDLFLVRRVQVRLRVLTQDPAVLVDRYRRELEATPGDILLQFGLSQALLAARSYEEALDAFRRLVLMAPDQPAFRADLGYAYFAAGKYEDAVALLEPYSKEHTEDIRACYALARTYLEQGEAGKALSLLEGLQRDWSDQADIFLHLGRCLAALKQAGRAHYYFYRHYMALGRTETAAYHREKAQALLPRDSDLQRELAGSREGANGGILRQINQLGGEALIERAVDLRVAKPQRGERRTVYGGICEGIRARNMTSCPVSFQRCGV